MLNNSPLSESGRGGVREALLASHRPASLPSTTYSSSVYLSSSCLCIFEFNSQIFFFDFSLCLSICLWNQSNLPVLLPKYIMFSTNWMAIKLPANIEVWPRGGFVNCPCLYPGYSPFQEFSPSCMFFVKETPENFTNLLHTLHAYCVIFCTLSVVWFKTHFCLKLAEIAKYVVVVTFLPQNWSGLTFLFLTNF